MSGSPPSFSDYLYFYSFMDRNVHAHFYRQPISIDCLRYCSFSFFREDYAETDIVLFLIFRIGLIKSAVLSSGLSTDHLPIASEGISYKMAMPVPFRISPCLSRPEIGAHPYLPYNLAVCSCMDIIYIRFSVTYFLYSFHSAWSFLFSWERLCPRNSIFSSKK